MDEKTLSQMWGALALRGMAAILFGIAAVFWPGITLVTLVYLFGAYVLASGLINLVVGLVHLGDAAETFWARILVLILGLGELGVGVYLLRHPQVTFATFIILIGATLIIRGLFDLFGGIFGEGSATYKTVSILGGLIAMVAGVILLLQPASAGVAFVWILGLYALITGPLLVALAFDGKHALENGRARRVKATK